jgi:nitrate/nitrite transporter NarK
MHAAAMVGLIGLLGALGRAIPAIAKGKEIHMAIASQLAMGVLLLIFLVLCIRSFIAARKARQAAEIQQ